MSTIAALFLTSTVVLAAPGAEPDPGARAEIAVKAIAAKSPGVATLTSLTKTAAGHDVPVLRLSKLGQGVAGPALLLVAGLDGRHRVGVETAVAVAEKLAAEPPAWLEKVTLYVIPCMNPDAFAAGQAPPAVDSGRLRGPMDADRDRRTGEDPAEDLNGDGVISLMRVREPKPGLGLTATLCDEPEWPGLMKGPDATKGEKAVWALLAEGIDNDGDGKFNEDGAGPEGYATGGGLDLEKNFPGLWPEFEDGAGVRPLSTPETIGLVQWCLAKPELAAVVVFGLHDTVVNVPEANKMDASGQVPRGILGDDKALYDAVSGKYREITGYTDAPRRDASGSFATWVYTTLGVPAFETPVWVRPDLVKEDKRLKPPAPPTPAPTPTPPTAPAPAGEPGKEAEPKKKPEAKTEEQKWVRYFEDYHVGGFTAWAAYQHAQLGPVEIGGFVPGARINPPAEFAAGLTASHAEFLGVLAGQVPSLDAVASAEREGSGLWRVRVRVTNAGAMATQTAMANRARAKLPTSLTLEVDPKAIVNGKKRWQEPRIAGTGGLFDAEWTVLADDGSTLTVTFTSPTTGKRTLSVPLK